jgi:hypothetical protein
MDARSNRSFAFFRRPNSYRFFDVRNENLSVADLSRLGCRHNGIDCFVDLLIGQNDFNPHFRQEIDRVFAAPINLCVAFLPATSSNLKGLIIASIFFIVESAPGGGETPRSTLDATRENACEVLLNVPELPV